MKNLFVCLTILVGLLCPFLWNSTVYGQNNCPPPPPVAPLNFGECGGIDNCELAIVSSLGTEVCASGFNTDLYVQAYEPTSSTVCRGVQHTWYYEWYLGNTLQLNGQGEDKLLSVNTPGTYTCYIWCNDADCSPETLTIVLNPITNFPNTTNPVPDFLWDFEDALYLVGGIVDQTVVANQAFHISPGNGNVPWPARYKASNCDSEGLNCTGTPSPVTFDEMSVEFWALFDQYRLTGDKMNIMMPASTPALWSLQLGPDEITFSGMDKSKTVFMDGIGRKSIEYYMDANWHHFAMTYDDIAGECKLYVDGQSPVDFQIHFPSGPGGIDVACVRTEFDIDGRLDELAFYQTEALSAHVIASRYINKDIFALAPTSPCTTFTPPGAIISSPCQMPILQEVVGYYDPMDFPVGFNPNDPDDTGTYTPSTKYQLANAPGPRYKPGNQLKRLYPWLHDNLYRTYGHVSGVNSPSPASQSAELMEAFADDWNYHLVLPRGTLNQNQHHIQLANDRPDLPLGHNTFWKQAYPQNLSPNLNTDAVITRFDLAEHLYLDCLNDQKIWSPLAPEPTIQIDGIANKLILDIYALPHLDRPIDLLTENGEVQPNVANIPCFDGHITANPGSPEGIAYYDWESNLPSPFPYTGVPKFVQYYAEFKTRWRKKYMKALLNDHRMEKTQVTWYSVDGMGGHFATGAYPVWTTVKDVLDQDLENDFFYSTPDMYLGSPRQWWKGSGVSHGISYYYKTRKVELLEGDSLCSPYVNAGYRGNTRERVRPGQWLGFLKMLSIYGGETFYAGFFDHEIDPRLWIWQLIMPAYAQGITSRYEKELRIGQVPENSVTNDPQFKFNNYNQDPTIATGVRKYEPLAPNLHESIYVIASTRQAFSNKINFPNLVDETWPVKLIDFEGNGDLEFLTRKQGSVYIYKQDPNPLALAEKEPVFYQLDSWHESHHPSYWSKDFRFEAEVYDELTYGSGPILLPLKRKTRYIDINGAEQPPAQWAANDFKDFVTYTSVIDLQSNSGLSNWDPWEGPVLSYSFRINSDEPNHTGDYGLFVRARAQAHNSGASSGFYYELIYNRTGKVIYSDRMGCVQPGTTWQWYTEGNCGPTFLDDLRPGTYTLRIAPENELLEIDEIVLDETSAALDLAPVATCNQPTPLTVNFEQKINCDGTVTFINHSIPQGGCNRARWWWAFEYADPSTQSEGSGPISYPPGASGTYENPTYDYGGPGTYYTKVGFRMGGSWAPAVLYTVVIPPNPGVSVNATSNLISICDGNTVQLNANGNTNSLTYSWYPSISVDDPDMASTIARPRWDGNGSFTLVTYTVTATDQNGCTAEDQVSIKVGNPGMAIQGLSDVTMVANGPIPVTPLSVTGTGGSPNYQFIWSPTNMVAPFFFSNTVTCSTQVTNSGQPFAGSPIGPAIIEVRMTDQNGCKIKDHMFLNIVPPPPTPKRDESQETLLSETQGAKFYPNPTNGMLNIEHQLGAVNIEVMNTQGQVLFESKSAEPSFQLDLSKCAEGVYIVHLFNGAAHIHQKNCVERQIKHGLAIQHKSRLKYWDGFFNSISSNLVSLPNWKKMGKGQELKRAHKMGNISIYSHFLYPFMNVKYFILTQVQPALLALAQALQHLGQH